MDKIKLKEHGQRIVDAAKRYLFKTGRVIPTLIWVKNGVTNFTQIPPFSTPEQKRYVFSLLQILLLKEHPDAFFTSMDGWVVRSEKDNEKDISIPPSENPDKEECIMVIGASAAAQAYYTIPYFRMNNQILFIKDEEINCVTADMPNIKVNGGFFDLAEIFKK